MLLKLTSLLLAITPLCTSLIHVPPGIEPRDVSEDAPAYRRVSTGWEDEWSPAAATDHVILQHGPLHKGFVGYEVSTGKVFSRRPKDTSPPVMNVASAYIVSSACEILKADGIGPMAWTAWEDVKLATVVQPWVAHVMADTGWTSKVHRLTVSGDHPTRWECECAVSEPENDSDDEAEDDDEEVEVVEGVVVQITETFPENLNWIT